MKLKSLLFLFLVVYLPYAEARRGQISQEEYQRIKENGPWYTGPLLAPSGSIAPLGDLNIEPYVNYFVYTGNYDKNWAPHSEPNFYSVNPQAYIQAGLTSFMDVTIIPQFFYNQTEGVSSTVFGDLAAGLAFQLLYSEKESWLPSIKLILKETFPTGKYQKLSPHKKETDLGGLGSFVTQAGLAFQKGFKLSDNQNLSSRFYFAFSIPSKVPVQGFNAYGGSFDTKGTVYPGSYFTGILGLEFSLTKNWVFALDIDYLYYNRTRFSGEKGHLTTGEIAFTSFTSINQISLAPAIEYNFSTNLGIIAGSWFTVAGRNALRFASGIIALNYYFSSE